jgi:hypothetical protein
MADELTPEQEAALPDFWKELLGITPRGAEGATGVPARGSACETLAAPAPMAQPPSAVQERRAGAARGSSSWIRSPPGRG